MRSVLLLMFLISFLIIAISAVHQMTVVATETTAHSIYTKDVSSLLRFDGQNPFFAPYPLQNDLSFRVRKVGHFVVYGSLATFFLLVMPVKQLWLRGFLAAGSSAFIGLLDEVHQHFLINRSGSILDVCINTGGSVVFVLLTMGISYVFYRIRL